MNAGWSLNAYAGATSLTAPTLIDSQSQQNAANVGIIAPSVTASNTNALLVNIFNLYAWGDAATDYGPPAVAGQNCRLIVKSGGSSSMPIWTDEQVNNIGNTNSRTAQCGSATIRNNTANSLLLQ